MTAILNRRLLLVLCLLTVFAIVGYLRSAGVSDRDVGLDAFARSDGDEVVLVYVGSSTCPFCARPEVPEYFRRARTQLEERARQVGASFVAVGIAKDVEPSKGWKHLQRIARFDEILAGRGRLGVGMQRYVYSSPAGPGGTPQLAVALRHRSYGEGVPVIEGERVVARYVGLVDIQRWLESGMPLPALVGGGRSR